MTTTIYPDASRQMAAWFARRPSFALIGEYSAGKSALLNALLGQSLLPTRVTATDLPAVWLTHGTGLRVQGLTFAGTLLELGIDDLTNIRAMEFLCIRIECAAKLLSEVDIIDTPGISDPRMTTVIVEEILNYIDFAIWCSPINQAWRQTERAFWKRVPPQIKAASALALTRADIMRSPADLAKVVGRCTADTEGSFAAVMPVSALKAESAMRETPMPDREASLQGSGIPDLQDFLARSVSIARTRRGEREERFLLTFPVIDPSPVLARKKPAKAVKVAQNKSDAAVAEIVRACTLAISDLVPALASRKQISNGIDLVQTALRSKAALDAGHLAVLTLALNVPSNLEIDTARVVTQVREELKDFAAGPWCTIGD